MLLSITVIICQESFVLNRTHSVIHIAQFLVFTILYFNVLLNFCVQLDRASIGNGSTFSIGNVGRCYSMSTAPHQRRAVSTCDPPTGLTFPSTVAKSPAPGTASAYCYRYTSLHMSEYPNSNSNNCAAAATAAAAGQGAPTSIAAKNLVSQRPRAETLDESPYRPRQTYTRREAEALHLLRAPQNGCH